MTQLFVGHGKWRPSVENVTRDRSAPLCDIFNLGSSYFHVPLTTVRHLLIVSTIDRECEFYEFKKIVEFTKLTRTKLSLGEGIRYIGWKSLIHTHTHTRLTALCPGLPGSAGTRKVKPVWILLKQETVSGSGISWAVCMSAPRSRQITTPAPHHSVFYRPDALPAAQPTASKHWRALWYIRTNTIGYRRNQHWNVSRANIGLLVRVRVCHKMSFPKFKHEILYG